MAEKQQARKIAKDARNSVPLRMRHYAADEVARLGCRLFEDRKGLTIAGYMPIGTELDSRLLMQDLERRGHHLALPRVVAEDAPLTFHAYGFGDPLEESSYHVGEPIKDAPIVEPDVILVPGLAFDGSLYRLGYGGGYYDRTLGALIASGKRVDVIGLAFAAQMVETLPRGEHDIPMSMVITEAGLSVPVLG